MEPKEPSFFFHFFPLDTREMERPCSHAGTWYDGDRKRLDKMVCMMCIVCNVSLHSFEQIGSLLEERTMRCSVGAVQCLLHVMCCDVLLCCVVMVCLYVCCVVAVRYVMM